MKRYVLLLLLLPIVAQSQVPPRWGKLGNYVYPKKDTVVIGNGTDTIYIAAGWIGAVEGRAEMDSVLFNGPIYLGAVNADSVAVTIQFVRDSAGGAVVVADSTAGDVDTSGTQIAAALADREAYADSGTWQEVPKSVFNTGIYIGNASDTAEGDSAVLTVGSGATKGYVDSAAGGINPEITGDITIGGNIIQANRRSYLSIYTAYAPQTDTFLTPIPWMPVEDTSETYIEDTLADSAQIIHPSVVYSPRGWPAGKRRFWLAGTPYPNITGFIQGDNENPHLWCSDDGISWSLFVSGTDSIRAPLWDTTFCDTCTYTINHCSDPEIFFDAENSDTLWYVWRTSGGSQLTLWITGSADGYIWTNEKQIINGRDYAHITNGDEAELMSPAVVVDTAGKYWMFTVDHYNKQEAWLNRWHSVRPDSGWTFVDSIQFDESLRPAGQAFWHFEVIPHGADELLGLFTYCDSGASINGGAPINVHLGVSTDWGETWDINLDEPVIHNGYRSSGYWEDHGGEEVLVVYHKSDTAHWVTGRTKVSFNGPIIQQVTQPHGRIGGGNAIMTTEYLDGNDFYLFRDSSDAASQKDTVALTAICQYHMEADSLIIELTGNGTVDSLGLYVDDSMVTTDAQAAGVLMNPTGTLTRYAYRVDHKYNPGDLIAVKFYNLLDADESIKVKRCFLKGHKPWRNWPL